MDIYQYYMLIFLLLYFGLIIGVRSWLLYRQTRIDATRNFGMEGQKKKAERIIQFALLFMLIIALNYLFMASNYSFFLPLELLDIGWLKTTGFVVGISGLLLTFAGQLQMKDSWRLGIDEQEEVELITSGFFSFSRHPIYLGLGIGFIGFFFIAPNVGSLLFLVIMFYGVNQKIKDEEAFLQQLFGERYEQYRARVNKWF